MTFEYKFGKKKSDASFSLEKQVEELTKQLEEKDEMILHDCEKISGLEQQIEMLRCLIETKNTVISNLKRQVELLNCRII